MMRAATRFALTAITAILALAATARTSHAAEVPADPAASCGALQRTEFANIPDAPTQITAADIVPAAARLPAYCRIQGYVAPNVGIEMRLPVAAWNGKFFYAGCSAACGSIALSSWARECDYPLIKGYACVLSDMGHQSGQSDGLWAYNNLQAKVDFGFRATHVAAVAGKAITATFYGAPPQRSYFMGCSTGGREAMVEAQRFPWDFDGIIAGAPVITEAGTAMDFIWNLQNSVDPDGRPVLSIADLQLVHQAVLAHDDLNDGVRDGIIGDPRTSRFDPGELLCRSVQAGACLTAAQIQAVRRIYAGPMNAHGEKLYHGGGMQPGSELNWTSFAPRPNSGPAPIEKSGVDTTRYMLSDFGPTWKFSQFDFDSDYKRLATMEVLYAADSVDLRQFKAAGGKLLVYQGWNDPAVAPLNSVDYYETAEKTLGGRSATQQFYRLFVVPGMNHCYGGDGAYAIDYLSYMEAWVEQGKPPQVLRAAHLRTPPAVPPFIQVFPLEPADTLFTRPVFPYPLQARYKGAGDSNDWSNFAPFDSTTRQQSTQ
jgi:hypothetical protein